MKYLAAPNGSPLTFPTLGGDTFLAFDGTRHATGEVKETTEAWIKGAAARALPATTPLGRTIDTDHPFAFSEVTDLMRDMRWIGKALARDEVAVGATGIGMKVSGRGVGLALPESARPVAPTVEVGHLIAVGPNISPKAFMNARGIVTAVNGTKVTCQMDEGDLRRVGRATGKKYRESMSLPLSAVEVIS